MYDNSTIEIKSFDGDEIVYLKAGKHEVHLFDAKSKTFESKGRTITKWAVHFKNESGSHFEDYLDMDQCLWKHAILSIACGISEIDKWAWDDLKGKKLIIHLKEESYTDKNGNAKMKAVLDKVERDPGQAFVDHDHNAGELPSIDVDEV